MTTYTVHLPPSGFSGETDDERIRFVPERPALLALIFPAIWLLWHRLWYAFAVYLLIAGIAWVLASWTGSAPMGLLGSLPGLYLFLEGRQLLRGRLERAGWRFAGVVEADSAHEADLRYFSGRTEPAIARTAAAKVAAGDVSPAPVPPGKADRQEGVSPIGIFGQ